MPYTRVKKKKKPGPRPLPPELKMEKIFVHLTPDLIKKLKDVPSRYGEKRAEFIRNSIRARIDAPMKNGTS